MGKKENFIELNGKRYDALSGALLNRSPQPVTRSTVTKRGTFVDGFIKPNSQSASKLTQPKQSPKTVAAPIATPAPKKPVMDIQRSGAAKLPHHAPKKSQTLMRSAVKKPEVSLKRKTKTTTHTHAVVQQPKFEIVKKLSHPKVDPKRQLRSNKIAQSEKIHRFAPSATVPKPNVVAAAIPAERFAQPTPVQQKTIVPALHAKQLSERQASLDVFEKALQRANSHMELPPSEVKTTKRKKNSNGKRAFSLSAATLAVLLIAGFVAFQNQANLTVRYASSKAGFSANLPNYKPSGYSVGAFTYSPGQVGVTYTNNVSNQSFSLVQKQSNLDSTALRDDFVASVGSPYKTIQSAGRTIYTYGNNNATWVNAGIWYQLDSAGSLTNDELVNLATSI